MITGKTINLRTIKDRDLDEMLACRADIRERGDYDTLELPNETEFKNKFRESAGFWGESFGMLLITDKNDRKLGELVYFKGLKYADGYEVGYLLYRRDDRGKGYMTEALKLFAAYLFSSKPITRLQANMYTENVASRRLAQKCGFTYEGTMRKAVFCRGRYFDLDLCSLLREECPSLEAVLASL